MRKLTPEERLRLGPAPPVPVVRVVGKATADYVTRRQGGGKEENVAVVAIREEVTTGKAHAVCETAFGPRRSVFSGSNQPGQNPDATDRNGRKSRKTANKAVEPHDARVRVRPDQRGRRQACSADRRTATFVMDGDTLQDQRRNRTHLLRLLASNGMTDINRGDGRLIAYRWKIRQSDGTVTDLTVGSKLAVRMLVHIDYIPLGPWTVV